MLLEGWIMSMCMEPSTLGTKLQNRSAVKLQKIKLHHDGDINNRALILGWMETYPQHQQDFCPSACLLTRVDVFVRSNIVYERLLVIYVNFPHWVTRITALGADTATVGPLAVSHTEAETQIETNIHLRHPSTHCEKGKGESEWWMRFASVSSGVCLLI